MASGAVRGECENEWARGVDCGFDEKRFHMVCIAIWTLTTLGFVAMTWRVGRENFRSADDRTSKVPRQTRCLLLVLAASFLRLLDHALYVTKDLPPDMTPLEREEGYGTYHSFATVCFLVALRYSVYIWADIVGAITQKQGAPDAALLKVRRGMDLAVLLQAPVSLYNAVQVSYGFWWSDTHKWPISYDSWVPFYFFIVGAVLGIGLTFIAALMLKVVRQANPEALECHGSLVAVTWLNFAEQILYDIGMLSICGLYFGADYRHKGQIQAVIFYLGHLVGPWIMQVQVLFFFLACKPTDAFRNGAELDRLLLECETTPLDDRAAKVGVQV